MHATESEVEFIMMRPWACGGPPSLAADGLLFTF